MQVVDEILPRQNLSQTFATGFVEKGPANRPAEAKNRQDFLYIRAIFAFVGFVCRPVPRKNRLKAADVAEFTQAWYNA